jgi:lipoprotein NlpI
LLKALALNPDHPIAHNELGIVFRKSGRFDEAKKSYEAALAIYPGYHYARRNLAVLCDLYLVDLQCALENYEAYMATVPSDSEATMWIVDIRNRIGQ